jgi:hypothetical protein
VLSTQKELAAALERAQEFERRAIHECLRRLDHYAGCLQAIRGDLADVLAFESAIAVGSTAVPEFGAPSLASPPEIPDRARSIGVDPSEGMVLAEDEPQSRCLLRCEADRVDADEKTRRIRRLVGAMRSKRTASHVYPPQNWDWKSQALFMEATRKGKRRPTPNCACHRTRGM